MAHQGVALLVRRGLEEKPHENLLGARAAQAQLGGEVVAQRSRDEQQSLAVFDRWIELPVDAGEKRRTPWHQLIRLESSREQDRMTSIATELALQLARADCSHGAKRAQTQEIKAFQLLGVERELV
jgi:hypothetical protein